MASIAAGTCSSGSILKSAESGRNGSSLFQYTGLKAVDSFKLDSSKPKGFISRSGMVTNLTSLAYVLLQHSFLTPLVSLIVLVVHVFASILMA